MNYLAHIYLSGDNEELIIGNFIADFITGNKYKNYPKEVQRGILFHRKIDSYTDTHIIFRQSKKRLFTDFRHYSGVIVDMFYDHFLAKNFNKYSSIPLYDFVSRFYSLLDKYEDMLPIGVLNILPAMKKHNWINNYKDISQLKLILTQMNSRTKNQTALQESIILLEKNYSLFEKEFEVFFGDLLMKKKKILSLIVV